MPRNPDGSYDLPGIGTLNPVVTNTTITTTWWNTTGNDLATAMGFSLDRTGLTGGMTGQLKAVDGTSGAPGLTFGNEPGTGFYRISPGTGEMDVVVLGTRYSRWTSAGFQESFDNGSTWKTPLYNNNGNQTFVGGLDFTATKLTIGGLPVTVHPTVTMSSSCGTFSTTSTSFTAITNLALAFTATGGPVHVQLVADDTTNPASLQTGNASASSLSDYAVMALTTDGANYFAQQTFGHAAIGLDGTTASKITAIWPVSSFSAWFTPGAGAVTLVVAVKSVATAGTTTTAVSYAKLCITQF